MVWFGRASKNCVVEPGGGGPERVVRVKHRYDLGCSVREKADVLNTEIGVVFFTEDLVAGFEDCVPPITEDGIWELVREAAWRYAKLTAFVAAEQQMDIQELLHLSIVQGDLGVVHPKVVVEALGRTELLFASREEMLAENVLYALDHSRQVEDREVILDAALGYELYLSYNAKELGANGGELPTEMLRDLIKLASGEHEYFDVFNPPNKTLVSLDAQEPHEFIRSRIPMEHLERIVEKRFGSREFGSVVEDTSFGVRVTLNSTKFLLFGARVFVGLLGIPQWRAGVVRCVVDGEGQELVVGTAAFPVGLPEEVLGQCSSFMDYRRPMYSHWRPQAAKGFRFRGS